MSDSLWPHGLQHARPPCPSPTSRVYSKSCPLIQWCHPTISSSVIPFSCPQLSPALGSFPMSWLFVSGGQNIGASASVLPMNIQGWFPFRWGVLMSFSLMMNVWWMFLLQNTEKQKELERRRIPPTLRKTLVTIWGFSPSSFFIRYFFNTPFWNLECFTQKQPVY